MRRRLVIVLSVLAFVAPIAIARAAPPTPEPNFAATILPEPCAPEPHNPYEAKAAQREGWDPATGYVRYPNACQRMRFTFGPITIKPGQNDVLIEPVKIEKPMQDGYITRFDPDLVWASNGEVPPIEQIHLHHATWLNLSNSYGTGPFFAAGEEKTIAPFPRGYGMPIKATDQWQLLYMIHSAVASPDVVYITYDVDFIPKAAATALNIKPVYPIWLDVRPSGYPVFNVQRKFGNAEGTCTWPREKCADFDPWGDIIPGQGADPNVPGTDWQLPAAGGAIGQLKNFQGGTLVGLGGHLHPGGIQNEIDLVRNGVAKRIYTGEAVYWDRTDSNLGGGPPTSWDFSMEVVGLPFWAVHVKPGDILRSNATYDTTHQSTYENMGIAVGFISPDGPDGPIGLDPFTAPFDQTQTCASGGLKAPTPTLCDKGVPTHGHLHENDNFGGPTGTSLTDKRAGTTSRVDIGGFLYSPGDLSMISMNGIPRANATKPLNFTNWDSAIDVYHSVTSCAYPCTGPTGTAFPLGNGRTSNDHAIDFDSGELGYGIPGISAAKQTAEWKLDLTGYEVGDIITYYCRIHPFMRGAFEVGA